MADNAAYKCDDECREKGGCSGHCAETPDRDAATTLRTGVWRRAPFDWAYRVEVKDYGSIAGVGFESRDAARKAMHDARIDAWKRRAAK